MASKSWKLTGLLTFTVQKVRKACMMSLASLANNKLLHMFQLKMWMKGFNRLAAKSQLFKAKNRFLPVKLIAQRQLRLKLLINRLSKTNTALVMGNLRLKRLMLTIWTSMMETTTTMRRTNLGSRKKRIQKPVNESLNFCLSIK